MPDSALPIILVMVTVASIGLIVLGLRRPGQQSVIEDRLAQFGNRVPTLEEYELSLPFSDRVLVPIARSAAQRLGKLAPKRNRDLLRQRLMEAGAPKSLGPIEFSGLRILIGGGLGGLLLLITLPSDSGLLMKAGLPLIVGVLGYLLPGVWLGRRISQRKSEIQRALPDAIDLLTISVEAGLGFDPALARVVEKWDNGLTREFGRTLSEIRMGQSRREAMRDLAKRVNVDDLNVFVSAIIQADQLGVSISQVLRIQSKQLRMMRRQRAEELAHKAPIKIIFPMVFLIFPSVYIVILGPAIPRILETFK